MAWLTISMLFQWHHKVITSFFKPLWGESDNHNQAAMLLGNGLTGLFFFFQPLSGFWWLVKNITKKRANLSFTTMNEFDRSLPLTNQMVMYNDLIIPMERNVLQSTLKTQMKALLNYYQLTVGQQKYLLPPDLQPHGQMTVHELTPEATTNAQNYRHQ